MAAKPEWFVRDQWIVHRQSQPDQELWMKGGYLDCTFWSYPNGDPTGRHRIETNMERPMTLDPKALDTLAAYVGSEWDETMDVAYVAWREAREALDVLAADRDSPTEERYESMLRRIAQNGGGLWDGYDCATGATTALHGSDEGRVHMLARPAADFDSLVEALGAAIKKGLSVYPAHDCEWFVNAQGLCCQCHALAVYVKALLEEVGYERTRH
jgi:hypothetical protein